MKNIDPVSGGENNPDVPKRINSLLKFMDEIKEPVLDIGARNSMGEAIEKRLNINLYNTHGDLNFFNWEPNEETAYKTVICSEVIEHLLNPALFLNRLKMFCDNDCVVYIFYPLRPHFFWTECHFHEYDRQRFLYLLQYTGYKISKYRWEFRKAYSWKFYFTGIRPLFLRWNIAKVRA